MGNSADTCCANAQTAQRDIEAVQEIAKIDSLDNKSYPLPVQTSLAKHPPHKDSQLFSSGGILAAVIPSTSSGQLYYPNGDYFEGDVHTYPSYAPIKGRMEFASKEGIYEGPYSNGLPAGQGKILYPSGSFYLGEVSEGKPHGLGAHTYSDGHRFIGNFGKELVGGKGVR